ncbi:MAG: prenyltransferase [Chloroflexus sp.]|nr:prenyltransferase [Chloroflexus sp.]
MAAYSQTLYGLWLMSRPLILPSGALAYAVGVALAFAAGPIDWSRQAIGLTLTMLANLAAHYADEYADADTDALANHTGVSGGSGAIAAGYASRPLALWAAFVVSGITLIGGAWATLSGAIPFAAGVILLIGLLGGWAYSLPPIALERRGWGELANALLGGLLMPLMAYACAHGLPPLRVYAQLAPVVAAALVCIIGVHWADRHADAQVGKYTLAVMYGKQVRWWWWFSLALAYGLPVALAGWVLPNEVTIACLLTLPVGLYTAIRLTRTDSPAPGATTMVVLMLAHIAGYLVATFTG